MSAYPKRIVCLTEETVETLYALGADNLIVGVSGFAVRPQRVRKEKPRISTYLDARFDDILALQPDLVLAWSDLQADMVAELIRRGVDVMCFNQRGIDGILDMIVRLGALVGLADAAEQYAAVLRAGLDDAAARGAMRTRKPRVYFEEWYDPLIGGIQWVSELVELCGGIDIFPEHRDQQAARGRIIADPREPVHRRPDILIASWCGKMFKPDVVRQRPGWEQFNPVVRNMMFEIPSPIILQPGPAALTDGVAAILRIYDTWESSLSSTSVSTASMPSSQ